MLRITLSWWHISTLKKVVGDTKFFLRGLPERFINPLAKSRGKKRKIINPLVKEKLLIPSQSVEKRKEKLLIPSQSVEKRKENVSSFYQYVKYFLEQFWSNWTLHHSSQ